MILKYVFLNLVNFNMKNASIPHIKICVSVTVLNYLLSFFLLIYNLFGCVYIMVDFEMIPFLKN